MDALIERLRLLERDHDPDGWPAVRMRDITALLAALEAAREDAWLTMESCPVNKRVLLWNQELGEMAFGHKPEDAPSDDAVIINCAASWADAWRPMPSDPEEETFDGPPKLSVVPAIDQARGKGVADEA